MSAPVLELFRFDRTERWLHWINAALVGVLVATGAALYWGELASIVGRRALLKDIHVIVGLGLPVPFLLSLPGRRGRALRRDLGALNRFNGDDIRWLRSERDPQPVADPDALRGIVSGKVPASWARRKRPRWYDDVSEEPGES